MKQKKHKIVVHQNKDKTSEKRRFWRSFTFTVTVENYYKIGIFTCYILSAYKCIGALLSSSSAPYRIFNAVAGGVVLIATSIIWFFRIRKDTSNMTKDDRYAVYNIVLAMAIGIMSLNA